MKKPVSDKKHRVIAVIPARFDSSRFPGKILYPILNKPMIQWVCEGARSASTIDEVWVATDDDRIEEVCHDIDIPVFRSRRQHQSGTDRIIEACESIKADIVVNIQGDEPLISKELIDAAVTPLFSDTYASVPVVTLVQKIDDYDDLVDPNVVKVVKDTNNKALYFSRHTIPALFQSGDIIRPTHDQLLKGVYYKHIGLYVYRHSFLHIFNSFPSSYLESSEKLEQLRILEYGYNILCVETDCITVGVDVPDDIIAVERVLKSNLAINDRL